MANSGVVDLVREDDDFDRDLKEAIAASLTLGMHSGTTGSSQLQEQDDEDMQRALALSMQTYEAEQQSTSLQPIPLQPPQQQQVPSVRLRKRCSEVPVAMNYQAEGVDGGPGKRQRSSSSPCSATISTSECGEGSAADDQDNSSRRSSPPQQQTKLPSGSGDLGKDLETAHVLVALSHSGEHTEDTTVNATAPGHPVAATPHSITATGLLQQQQHQGLTGLTTLTGLGQSGPVHQSATLELPSILSQQPPPLQQHHGQLLGSANADVEDTDSLDDLEMGDWDDDSIGILPSASTGQIQPPTATHTGSNAGHDQPPQQQQDALAVLDPLHIARHLLYQLHDSVYWLDPVSRVAFTGQIFSVEGQEGAGCLARKYIVDTDSAVRYVEASCEQLLPRVMVGDYVWCKPNMAVPAAWSERTACSRKQLKLVQEVIQRRICCGNQDVEWLVSPWVQGCVVSDSVQLDNAGQAVPVVEISLPCGGRCWFPVHALQPVKESGESSSMAAYPGQQQQHQQQGDDVVLIGSTAEGAVCGQAGVAAENDDQADSATPRAAAPGAGTAQERDVAAADPLAHTQQQIQHQAHGTAAETLQDTTLVQQDDAHGCRQEQQQAAGTLIATAVAVPSRGSPGNSCPACAGVAGAAGVDLQHVGEAEEQQPPMQEPVCSRQGTGVCGVLSSCRCSGTTALQASLNADGLHQARSEAVSGAAGAPQQ